MANTGVSGTKGYALVNGAQKTADKWSADLDQAAPDRSNFMTQGEPLNAPGQRTGSVTIEGPWEGVPLGVDRGDLVTVSLGILADLAVGVTIRVTTYHAENNKDTGPRWSITGSQYGAATLQGALGIAGL